MNQDDLNKYIKSIQQETIAEEKTVKIARLIVLLTKIEKELRTIKQTLNKLKENSQQYNRTILPQVEEKIATVDRLSAKITRAKLNLNFFFL